jgi:hypothetical protein
MNQTWSNIDFLKKFLSILKGFQIFTLFVFGFSFSKACKQRHFEPSTAKSVETEIEPIPGELYPQPPGSITLTEYTKLCLEELGSLPDTIDCANGESVEALSPETKSFPKKDGTSEEYVACSNPTLALSVSNSCSGNTIYHRFKNELGSEVVTICRRDPLNEAGQKRLSVGATIGYNPKSGATCFFKFKKNTPFQNAAIVPGPARPEDGSVNDPRRNWETPGFITNMIQGSCVNCHSAYPWIRGPHTTKPGLPLDKLVPFNHYGNAKPRGNEEGIIDKTLPYYIVAREALEKLNVTESEEKVYTATGMWTPVVLDETKFPSHSYAKACVSCHRLGQGRMLKYWSPSAFGIYPPDFKETIQSRLSSPAVTFPTSIWHYGNHLRKLISQDEAAWKAKIEPAIMELSNCGKNPAQCAWRTLPEKNGTLPAVPSSFKSDSQAGGH